jgi:hypothetical protein
MAASGHSEIPVVATAEQELASIPDASEAHCRRAVGCRSDRRFRLAGGGSGHNRPAPACPALSGNDGLFLRGVRSRNEAGAAKQGEAGPVMGVASPTKYLRFLTDVPRAMVVARPAAPGSVEKYTVEMYMRCQAAAAARSGRPAPDRALRLWRGAIGPI